MKRIPIAIIALLLISGFAVWYVLSSRRSSVETETAPRIAVSYLCNEGRTIQAIFYEEVGSTVASQSEHNETGGLPAPGGSVHLALSDGRELTLRQTVSASGVRYSNGDATVAGGETFVFWSKGNGALVLESNVEKSYIGCVEIVPDPGGLTGTYANSTEGFSIRYPSGWRVESNYVHDLRPGTQIHGVKFHVPDSLAAGTNLSSDTGVSVEAIYGPDLATSGSGDSTSSCAAQAFLLSPPSVNEETIDGVDYSIAMTTEAAAGNRFEEIVYVVRGTDPCIAVRYFIHYGVLENYEPGTIQEFDRKTLLEVFDAMRRTLTIAQ